MLCGLVEPRLFVRMSRIPAHSSTARTGPPAITPVPDAATATTTAPAPAGAARPAWGPALLDRCRRGGGRGRGRGRGRDFRSRRALALRRFLVLLIHRH